VVGRIVQWMRGSKAMLKVENKFEIVFFCQAVTLSEEAANEADL